MPQTKKVILYGSSLFIAGLDSSLSAAPGLEIRRLEVEAGSLLEQVRTGTPDVIVVDLGVAPGNLTFNLLQKFPDVTLLGLNPENDQLLILTIQQRKAQEAHDLLRVIEEAPLFTKRGESHEE